MQIEVCNGVDVFNSLLYSIQYNSQELAIQVAFSVAFLPERQF